MASQATQFPNARRRLNHARRVLSHLESVAAKPRRFVVESDYCEGNYIAEVDLSKSNATDTVKAILDGQALRPRRVYELVDVSEEFAGRVAEAACEEFHNDGVTISDEAARFCRWHGVDVRELEEDV